MKMTSLFGLAAALFLLTVPVQAFTSSDVDFWVGTGEQEAVLVVDWKSGGEPQSLAWGFRWDGEATGRTMMDAITGADPRFFEESGFGGGTVYGLGYDLDGDGGSFVPSTDGSDTGFATDEDDHYAEGWLSAGFWSYWVSEDGVDWGFSGLGIASRVLSDGDWDGWSWAPGFASAVPSVPTAAAPIPEPSALSLLLVGTSLGLFLRRSRR